MKQKHKILFFILSHFISAELAFAKEGGFFSAALYYYTEEYQLKTTSSSNKGSTAVTNANLSLGYTMASNLILGIKYYNETKEEKFDIDDDDELKAETTAYGVLAGYDFDGALIAFSYILDAEKKNSSSDTTYSEGEGYIIDLAYFFDVKGWGFGPQFSIINLEYKKYANDGTEVDSFESFTENNLYPYFAAKIQF